MGEDRTWILRPPSDNDADLVRPIVSVGPPVEQWTAVVEESRLLEAEAERDKANATLAYRREQGISQWSKANEERWELEARAERAEAEVREAREALQQFLDAWVGSARVLTEGEWEEMDAAEDRARGVLEKDTQQNSSR
jgi:hypothetical protein